MIQAIEPYMGYVIAFLVGTGGTGVAQWLILGRKVPTRDEVAARIEAVEQDALTAMENQMKENYIKFISGPMLQIHKDLGVLSESVAGIKDQMKRIDDHLVRLNSTR